MISRSKRQAPQPKILGMGKNKTLKELIIESGMTHQQLADAIGVSQPRVSDWLRPGYDLRMSTAVRISKALNVSLKTLAASIGVDTEGIPDDQEAFPDDMEKHEHLSEI
jgi:transcriptional regulator with XRE-family HTH domain